MLHRTLWTLATFMGLVAALPQAAAAQTAGTLQLVSNTHCMDVYGYSSAAGAQVVQWGCHGGANQRWVASASGGYYTLRVASSGQCLDVWAASTAPGAAMSQWHCHGAANQQFSLRPQGTGHALVARHSNLCVGVEGGSSQQGARLVQQPCNGGANQTWVVNGMAPVAAQGRWSALQNLSVLPVAAAHLPNGKLLFWSSSDRLYYGSPGGRTYTSIYDPATGTASEVLVTQTGHDMFCPGTANLADGRIHVSGGTTDVGQSSIYDPSTDSWSAAARLNTPRGYQGNVTMANGDVFSIGGSWTGGVDNKNAEVWSPATNAWRNVPAILDDYILTNDALGQYRSDNHAWLFAASGGRVFHAGPSKNMHWFNPAGNGSVTFAGTRGADDHAMNGNAVMYDVNKILAVGGSPNYDNTPATRNAHVIDIGPATPTVSQVASMAYARAAGNSVVLPTGQVVVVGGQSTVSLFTDDYAVLVPELFDPVTRTFRTVAPMSTARAYHSVAMLLADGRVLTGGGGLCGGCPSNHLNVQVWSPPYLFNLDGTAAQRPTLTSAPTTATAGTSIGVNTGGAVAAFSLVRLSSVTHSLNNEQRRVPLTFTTTATNSYSLALPADRGILVPGYYMLFALNSGGVPSVSRMIRIN